MFQFFVEHNSRHLPARQLLKAAPIQNLLQSASSSFSSFELNEAELAMILSLWTRVVVVWSLILPPGQISMYRVTIMN
jgi:hypothetical protein